MMPVARLLYSFQGALTLGQVEEMSLGEMDAWFRMAEKIGEELGKK